MKLTAEKLKKLIKEEMENLSEMMPPESFMDEPAPDDAGAGEFEAQLRSSIEMAKNTGMSMVEIMAIVAEICEN